MSTGGAGTSPVRERVALTFVERCFTGKTESECQLGSELDLAGSERGLVKQSSQRNRVAAAVEQSVVVVRRREIGMIEGGTAHLPCLKCAAAAAS